MLHWSKTRGTPQHNASTHESLSCADKRPTTAASGRKKYTSICSTTIICTSIILPLLSLHLRRVWMIRNRYHGTYVNTSYTCQYRLGVDMNTEPFFIIPDEVVHDVKSQATKVWGDHSFRWIQPRCSSMTMTHASDRTATQRRWCSHPPILSLLPTLSRCSMLIS